MSDVKLNFDNFLCDVELISGDLATDDTLQSKVIISLFTDRYADDDDPLPYASSDRRGFWGDAWPDIDGDKIGSKLWLLWREKQTNQTLERARGYAVEALQNLIDDGYAVAVDVLAVWYARGVLALGIQIDLPTGETDFFQFLGSDGAFRSVDPGATLIGQETGAPIFTEDTTLIEAD